MTARSAPKRKLYLYTPDVENFAHVGFSNKDHDSITDVHWLDAPCAPTWKPKRCHTFEDNPPVDGDFPAVVEYWRIPLMTERAWAALRPLIGYCCEALPIIHPSGKPHFLVHVMDTIDALDADASTVRRHEGQKRRIYRIDRYAFHFAKLKGKHIFKLPHLSGSELFVDDEFRHAVEVNRLRGLRFDDLPMAK